MARGRNDEIGQYSCAPCALNFVTLRELEVRLLFNPLLFENKLGRLPLKITLDHSEKKSRVSDLNLSPNMLNL